MCFPAIFSIIDVLYILNSQIISQQFLNLLNQCHLSLLCNKIYNKSITIVTFNKYKTSLQGDCLLKKRHSTGVRNRTKKRHFHYFFKRLYIIHIIFKADISGIQF
jgi:hypothetical protein